MYRWFPRHVIIIIIGIYLSAGSTENNALEIGAKAVKLTSVGLSPACDARFDPSFCRYLIDQGANVAAVNNDGELPIDICETDEVGDMLQREIDIRGEDDCCAARRQQTRLCVLGSAHLACAIQGKLD